MKTYFPVVLKWDDDQLPEAKVIYKSEYKKMETAHQVRLLESMIALLTIEKDRRLKQLYGESNQ